MGSLERGLEPKKPTGFHPAPLAPSVQFRQRIQCLGLSGIQAEVQMVTKQAPVESTAVFAVVATEAGWYVGEQ
jgi:hypothetical protein